MSRHYAPPGYIAAYWTAINIVLHAREIGIETDTRQFKFGDGTTAWNSLPYAGNLIAPGGGAGAIQYKSGSALAGATDALIVGGQLALPVPASLPVAPATAADGVKLFGPVRAAQKAPHFMRPDGIARMMQGDLLNSGSSWLLPIEGQTTLETNRLILTATGTPTAAAISTASRFTRRRRVDYLQTVAAVGNLAGFRTNAPISFGSATAGEGGFLWRCRWGIATGASNTTKSGFTGLRFATGAPTNVDPSTLTVLMGMGWDAADTQMQFLRNDGAGTCTKIALGASFPVPTTDKDRFYDVTLYQPPGSTKALEYEITDVTNGVTATGGAFSTDLPGVDVLLTSIGWINSGATSAVSGYSLFGLQFECEN